MIAMKEAEETIQQQCVDTHAEGNLTDIKGIKGN
jgi:hypothetical protein